MQVTVGQAGALVLLHRGRIAGQDLYAAGGAFREPAAAVQDVDAGVLDRQDELGPGGHLERGPALDGHCPDGPNLRGCRFWLVTAREVRGGHD